MKITTRMLQAKRACSPQLTKFTELFPEGTEITETLCVQHASVFQWAWAAENLLSAPARAEYDKVRASAWAEYDKVCASTRAEYGKASAAAAAAAAEYNETCKIPRLAFEKATAGLTWAEYSEDTPEALEYKKVSKAAWTKYLQVRADAQAERGSACAAARAEYDKVCAAAFARGWEADHAE